MACHTPEIGGVAGIYSDFLLHRVIDTRNLGSGYAEVPNHSTAGWSSSAGRMEDSAALGRRRQRPYFHDGGSHTLEAAIRRHQGDAASVTRAYESLPASDREAIDRFLKSLKAPTEAKPANTRARGIIAMTD